MNIFALFYKKPKHVKQSAPRFNITETMPPPIDIEVSEISYEEYQNAITKERRLSKRHSPKNK
jgi:hypothetical protein